MKQYLLSFSFLLIALSSYGQETKVVLDSNIVYWGNSQNEWILRHKKYYEYDSEVQLTHYEHYDRFGFQKERYSYNKQDQIDTIFLNSLYIQHNNDTNVTTGFRAKSYTNNLIQTDITYFLNQLTNSWYIIEMLEYEYNDNGKLINAVTGNFSRIHYEYNDDNLLILTALQYKTTHGDWYNSDYSTYEYDNNDNLTKITSIEDDYSGETIYTYDSLNRRISETRSWTDWWGTYPGAKFTFEYDNEDRLIARYYYNQGGDNAFDRYLFFYHVNGQLEEYNWQKRDSLTAPWRIHIKDYNLFNNDEQIVESYKNLIWDRDYNDWKYGHKIISHYNEFDLLSEKIDTRRSDNFQNAFPIKDLKEQWFYSEKEIIIPELPPIEENCPFLNPYLPFTTVHCDNWEFYTEYQLQIYSIDGRFVYNKNFIGCDGFRVEKQLNKGWYVFIVLENGKPIQKQKILIFD